MHTELEHERSVTHLLRELPDAAVRPYDWQEFQRRALAAPAAAAHVAGLRALAAVIVITLAVLATAIRFGAGPHPAHLLAKPVASNKGAPAAGGEALRAERAATTAQDWLEKLPREPALVHVGTRAAVETLEDHIAQVDDLLTTERAGSAPAERLQLLQRERVQLVNSLVQVRYAETLADAAR
ncbi:MAG TPA: hypothetical protein VLV25_00200 [Steroidobacteraceae bacterium]|nr:hypothetical protein [Steroidobacteraceae bacterium]